MPLNRPECRPQKFVMVTQVAAGRLVPPFNPRASRCHPPIHRRVGATPQSTSRHVRMVPPVSSSPAGSAGKSKPVPPVSPKQCHPSVPSAAKNGKRRQDGATRQFRGPVGAGLVGARRQPGATPQLGLANWCHPPVRKCKLGATPQSGGRKWRHRSGPLRPVPGWLVPALNPPDCQNGATRQFGAPPTWCHLPTRNGQLVPPPNPGGGSGVVDPGLSAQNCSRSPALIDSNSSPNAEGCARW